MFLTIVEPQVLKQVELYLLHIISISDKAVTDQGTYK